MKIGHKLVAIMFNHVLHRQTLRCDRMHALIGSQLQRRQLITVPFTYALGVSRLCPWSRCDYGEGGTGECLSPTTALADNTATACCTETKREGVLCACRGGETASGRTSYSNFLSALFFERQLFPLGEESLAFGHC